MRLVSAILITVMCDINLITASRLISCTGIVMLLVLDVKPVLMDVMDGLDRKQLNELVLEHLEELENNYNILNKAAKNSDQVLLMEIYMNVEKIENEARKHKMRDIDSNVRMKVRQLEENAVTLKMNIKNKMFKPIADKLDELINKIEIMKGGQLSMEGQEKAEELEERLIKLRKDMKLFTTLDNLDRIRSSMAEIIHDMEELKIQGSPGVFETAYSSMKGFVSGLTGFFSKMFSWVLGGIGLRSLTQAAVANGTVGDVIMEGIEHDILANVTGLEM